jgi:methylated-DNA-[protein]-cysteine S-methyltransferase
MTARAYSCVYASPIGPIELVETDGALSLVRLMGSADGALGSPPVNPPTTNPATGSSAPTPLLRRAQKQLAEYFAGRRRTFDLPLAAQGTSFQQNVWRELATIPFGTTSTYGAIARAVGQPQAARAVGGAIGANPLAIVVPCHRVLAGDRRLTGFSGGDGVPTKVALLSLEGCEFRA